MVLAVSVVVAVTRLASDALPEALAAPPVPAPRPALPPVAPAVLPASDAESVALPAALAASDAAFAVRAALPAKRVIALDTKRYPDVATEANCAPKPILFNQTSAVPPASSGSPPSWTIISSQSLSETFGKSSGSK